MVLVIVLAKGKFPLDYKVEYYKKFIPLIDNWSVCSIFCGESKLFVQSSEIGWNLIDENIASQDEFRVRFAVILMLSQLIKADYLSQIFKSINKIEFRGDYYVDMAVAWLLATMGAKFPNDLFAFIEKSKLPLSGLNNTAQKIKDSRRYLQ